MKSKKHEKCKKLVLNKIIEQIVTYFKKEYSLIQSQNENNRENIELSST